MKKSIVIVALLGGWILSVSAEKVVDYQMGETAGTPTSGLQNSGSDPGSITGDAPDVATDGAGNLHYSALSAGATRKQALSTTYSSGMIQLEFRVTDWDYTANAAGDGIAFSLWDTAASGGLKAMVDFNASGTRVRVSGASTGKQKVISSFTGSDLVVRAVANLDANTYTADYNLGGGGWVSIASDEVLGVSSIDEFRLITSTDSAWGTGSSADVDYVTMETVPEPATLGLFGFAAMGLYLARSKRRSLRS